LVDFYGDDNYFSFTRETMWTRSLEHFHTHFLPGCVREKYLTQMLGEQGIT
jgi:hypothetical protein